MRRLCVIAILAWAIPTLAAAQDEPPSEVPAESTEHSPQSTDEAAADEPEAEPAPEAEAEPAPEPEAEPAPEAEAEPAPEPEAEPAPEPQRRASSEPDAVVPATNTSAILGIVTILAAVGTVTGLSMWIERDDNVGRCATYAMEDPRTRGCLNVGAIADQRDVGLGLFVGFGALTVGAAIAWAVVAATTPSPTPTALACGPGVMSFACAGRF